MENKEYDGQLWATSYALTAKDLYTGFPYSKYLRKEIIENYDMRYIPSQVLKYFFYLVLNDIIDKNVTLKFPPGTRAYIEMCPVSGEAFERARQNGAFQDVDFLASNFTGYQLQYRYNTRYGKWTKRIHVNKKMKDAITANTNAGKQYG